MLFLRYFLGFVLVFGCFYFIRGDEQCQTIIETVSMSASCQSLGNCTGLQCLNASSGIITSFTVDKCQDPLLVTLTLISNNETLLYDTYNATTTIMVTDNLMIKLNTTRNATYAWIKVDSVNGWSVIPVTAIPLNTTDCMCKSVQNIVENEVVTPFEYNCMNNSECSGLQCSFSFGEVQYTVETEALPCADPPGFVLIIKRANDGHIIYEHFFNSSANSSVFGFPLHVTVVHRQYSMFIEVDITVGGQVYILVPYSQIILDKTSCIPDMPEPQATFYSSILSGSIPVVAPSPIPVSAATCDKVKEIAAISSSGGIVNCESNDNEGCDTVSCSLFGYVSKTQILPCHNPPGFHVTITDPDGNILYNNIITNTTNVHISGFTITFTIDHNVPNAIGIKVSYSSAFGLVGDIIPHTEIPIDRCLCNNNPVITSGCGVSMVMTSSMPSSTSTRRSNVIMTSMPIVPQSTSIIQLTSTGRIPTPTTGSNVSQTAIAISVPLVIGFLVAVVALVVIGVIILYFKYRVRRQSFGDTVLLTDVADEKEVI